MIGSGSDGVWNDQGASWAFRIAAPFYKTPLFFLAVGLSIAAVVWMFYRYRMQLVAERVRLRMQAQNDERLRIAQAMHDSFLQGIQGSSLMVYAAMEKIEPGSQEARTLLERALRLVEYSTEQARDMLVSLRANGRTNGLTSGPAPRSREQTLLSRLQSVAESEAALYPDPPVVSVESTGSDDCLSAPATEDVFLIAAEALRNALRHARAKRVLISLDFGPQDLELTIADDGVGISEEVRERGRDGHFGLRGMRERAERNAGILKIECPEGQGTKLCLSLPLTSGRHPIG